MFQLIQCLTIPMVNFQSRVATKIFKDFDAFWRALPLKSHRRNEERGQGGPGPPNKKQNGTNKEQNWGKRTKMGSFWEAVFHENTSRKSKFISKGAEFFWPPPIL